MKRSVSWVDGVSVFAFGGLLSFTASVYGRLPERMATHFNLEGEPNGWMSRPYATWGFDAFALAVWGLLRLSPRWLPRDHEWRKRAEQSPMATVALLCMLLLVAVGGFLVWSALHPGAPRGAFLNVILGGFALAISSLLPRTRRNPVFGVRTAFSLTSDENWLRANRFASYTFGLAGVSCLVCAAVGAHALGVVLFVAAAVAPSVYSWAVADQLPPSA